jgi:phosphoglycolate phosphatase-like HAD superfamily hydrolase
MKQTVALAIFDLDNTLFDWVEMWYAMFSAKLKEVARISGIPEEVLKTEFKAIHQRHGTSEYAFAILELPSLQAKHADGDLATLYDEAMHAYYSARKKTLRLYPGVMETLMALRDKGCSLVAYTESMAFYSAQRLRDLDLDLVLDVLYSPEDHQLPRRPEDLRRYPPERYQLRHTDQHHTPKGELKPNPDVLRSILTDCGTPSDRAIYVGDSEFKDIAMANAVGVTSVLAKYGKAQSRPEYNLLREVTHWTAADVAREKAIAEGRAVSETDLVPKYTLEKGIDELLGMFEFTRSDARLGRRPDSVSERVAPG